ncbi:MAG: lytic murein transglycosylase [Pseudomonadota bacterium]
MNQDCKTLSAALWAVVIVTASLLTAQLPAQAEVSGAEVRKTTPGPARTDAAFRAFLIGLWPEAQAAGVSRQTFDAALSGLKPDFKLPDLLLPGEMTVRKVRQAEFTREPRAYLDRAYLARLAKTGRGLAQKWRLQLDLIEAKFGVDRQTVLAIWGRETAFGTYKPKHDAIRVLATQGFAGRRATLFRGELIDALRLLEAGVPRAKMRASWAGAMGMTQFMPSEFFKHKHDFAGDGYADLFNSVPDALASAARQLSNKGWQSGRTWGYEVVVPTRSDCAEEGPPGARSLRAWASGGFVRVAGRQFPDAVLDDRQVEPCERVQRRDHERRDRHP